MTTIVLKAMVAALSAIGSVFSIAPYLKRESLRRRPSVGRALFALSLCVIGIIAGWLVFDEAKRRDRPQGTRLQTESGPARMIQPQVESATVPVSTQPSRTSKADGIQTSATVQPLDEQRTSDDPGTKRVRIQDEAGNLVPGLILIAQRELPSDAIVQGTLRMTTTPPDETLQGLITANATLTVTTRDVRHLIDTIDVNTRGGGFTAEAAIRQARERLDVEFEKRLKEHP